MNMENKFFFRQKEFKFFWLDDNVNKSFQQRDLAIEFGRKTSFLFHFVGFGDSIRMDRRKLFHNQSKHLAIFSNNNLIAFVISGREFLFGKRNRTGS